MIRRLLGRSAVVAMALVGLAAPQAAPPPETILTWAGGNPAAPLPRPNAIRFDRASGNPVTLFNRARVSTRRDATSADNVSPFVAVEVDSAPGADLSVTLAAAPTTVNVGQSVTITTVVTNHGPDPATGVMFSGLEYIVRTAPAVAVTPSQGTCPVTGTPGVAGTPIACTLGSLASGAAATITIVATPTEGIERRIEVEQVHRRRCHGRRCVGEDHGEGASAACDGQPRARVIHENAPDDARGHSEEVRTVLPVLIRLPGEAQVRFVDEGGRLKRVTRALAAQMTRRDSTKLGVNQLHQPRDRLVVATRPFMEQPGDLMAGRFGHGWQPSARIE